jgi:hypothetical protein
VEIRDPRRKTTCPASISAIVCFQGGARTARILTLSFHAKEIFLHEERIPALGALLNTIDHGGLVLQLDGSAPIFSPRSTRLFVPSVPTPFAGAVFILTPERVHPLDVPFTQAIKSISRWGSGSKELVAAMKTESALK